MLIRGAILAALVTMLAPPAAADQSGRTSATTAAGEDELLRRVEALEAQIAELRSLIRLQREGRANRMEAPESGPGPGSTPSAEPLKGLELGAALDTYYAFNFNRPIGRVNLFRAYDVSSNAFSLNQASVILESPPRLDEGRRFGGRLDLQYGQATETLQGNPANEPRAWVYRNVFQAYGTFVAPIGSGLAIDFGKWGSALGIESNYSKDQLNYSRSYWFDFLPFYHMGLRASYGFTDRIALAYWLTNGTQQTEPVKDFKDQFAGLTIRPVSGLTWNVNYYFGEEHPDIEPLQGPVPSGLPTQPGLSVEPASPRHDGRLHIVDSYVTWLATPATTIAAEADYVNARLDRTSPPGTTWGGAAYVRQQLTPKVSLSARGEYVRDGAVFTSATQTLKEATVTGDVKVAEGFLARTEWRLDCSTLPSFLTSRPAVLRTRQQTLTLGLIWWWGNKQGTW